MTLPDLGWIAMAFLAVGLIETIIWVLGCELVKRVGRRS